MQARGLLANPPMEGLNAERLAATAKRMGRVLHRQASSGDKEARSRITRHLGQALLPESEFELKRRCRQ